MSVSMSVERAARHFANFLAGWVAWMAGHARAVSFGGLLLSVISVVYFVQNAAINTSTSDMLSKDLPFRQKSMEIDRAFPQTDSTLIVVIDGQTADIADDAALALGAAMRRAPNLYQDVYDLQGEPFFRRNGLLYLGLDELYDLSDRLAEAQPFLSSLWRDSTLRGLFRMLGLAVDETLASPDAVSFDLGDTFNAMAEAAEAQAEGRFHMLSWTRLMGGDDSQPADRRRFIVVQPAKDHGALRPASDAIDGVRALARELRLTPKRGVRVRLTGSAALDEEELQSVETGMGAAAVVSLILVCGLLGLGLRQVSLVFACLGTLIAGLTWTAAFAILTIGTLNLISVAFAVLFIGLSVDFGIHFALRYREQLWLGFGQREALAEAARAGGGALALCAVSAALGFFAFLPTAYVGLAELGLIAGAGMFIALFANLTLLPALIAFFPPAPTLREARPRPGSDRAGGTKWIIRHARRIVALGIVLGIIAAALAPSAHFDFDPLNLKDPGAESVSTLRDLMADGSRNHHTIDILAPNLEAANALREKLDRLDLVGRTVTLSSFVPAFQDEKLAAIQNLALLVAPALSVRGRPKTMTPEARLTAWTALAGRLAKMADRGPGTQARAAERLSEALSRLVEADPTGGSLVELENRLLTGLPGRLEVLNQSLRAEPVNLASLPAVLRSRWVAADGRALLEVAPKQELTDRNAVRAFVAAVRQAAPDAVGSPVVILEAGRTVLGAFLEAGVTAALGITAVLWVVLGRLRSVALVFAPLVLAGLWTVALATLLGQAFNLANVIVLPLLFGLGVAGGIHLVARSRQVDQMAETLQTSTPRAVLFSALTTIGSFGSISLSAHPGTSSMGVLLTLTLLMILAATLVVLPAMLSLLGDDRKSGPD